MAHIPYNSTLTCNTYSKFSSRHTTRASLTPKVSSHTLTHVWLTDTCKAPTYWCRPPTSLTLLEFTAHVPYIHCDYSHLFISFICHSCVQLSTRAVFGKLFYLLLRAFNFYLAKCLNIAEIKLKPEPNIGQGPFLVEYL